MILILTLCMSLVACGNNNNNDDSNGSDSTPTTTTTQNDGMITDTGTDTNIIDRVESGILGTDTK